MLLEDSVKFFGWKDITNMFGSVVAIAFQITFCAKMHANDVFSFFKNYFWHQHIKTIQNVQTILNFSKKKKFQIFWERGLNRVPKRFLNVIEIITACIIWNAEPTIESRKSSLLEQNTLLENCKIETGIPV